MTEILTIQILLAMIGALICWVIILVRRNYQLLKQNGNLRTALNLKSTYVRKCIPDKARKAGL